MERFRIHYWHAHNIFGFDWMYRQVLLGNLDITGIEAGIGCAFHNVPLAIEAWKEFKGGMSPEFIEYVEDNVLAPDARLTC